MQIFSSYIEFLLDFLFPKKKEVLELESLSSSQLMSILPHASIIDENILALFDYKHELVRELIWELKYTGNRRIAEKLGTLLYDVITEEISERHLFEKFNKVLLIPVPIADKRRNERGWNQAELLAECVAKIENTKPGEKTFKYLPGQLVKHRHTESQTKTANKRERLENLRDSMRVQNPASVADRCIILLDDVVTTGSTFAEARRALKHAGAKKIICIAVAH